MVSEVGRTGRHNANVQLECNTGFQEERDIRDPDSVCWTGPNSTIGTQRLDLVSVM